MGGHGGRIMGVLRRWYGGVTRGHGGGYGEGNGGPGGVMGRLWGVIGVVRG